MTQEQPKNPTITVDGVQLPKYVVLNEHTLCYRQSGSVMLGVLHSSVLRGGDHQYGPVAFTSRDKLREATLEDFETYRVRAEGHLLSVKSRHQS
ncbi:hypothetical protein [Pseudomonas syringae]|uniref:hypothetical protein n=1 Tax=Pseudomonas syringae TaxID=317 RepID=UPI001F2FD856|nr:hypothetical protein [Pseudomonas syringae]MCF5372017.1 hypothetical protein [Pseudomonas syringae]MCF5381990.1 hypothetical protein [Pseudomonas syringae]MCF5419477.1 hypothetical protein [Pseudomonas syringae]MCF5452023.1 hypothetical protein [Pseudomonas syringae]MCF5456310.1 hypothetical protein [Pseudomonas syringae]